MYSREKIWRTNADYLATVIMTDMGHRCGYVGIPDSHILYSRHYGDHVPELGVYWEYIEGCLVGKRGIISVFCAAGSRRVSADIVFDVHGSTTYSGGADWSRTYPVPNTDLWWLGYDCAHAGDGKDLTAIPEEQRKFFYSVGNGPVRSLEYCIGECESLAHQLKDAQEVYTELLFRKWTN